MPTINRQQATPARHSYHGGEGRPLRAGRGRLVAAWISGSPWTRFICARTVGLGGVVLAILMATFALVRLIPGDPARLIAGAHAGARELAIVRAQLGLNGSLWSQFRSYFAGLAHFNLGRSFVTGQPVTTVISQHLPATVELAAFSMLLIVTIAVPTGLLVGIYTRESRHPGAEITFSSFTGVAASLPTYLAGTVLVFVFAITFHLLPATGRADTSSVILPAVSVAIFPTALLARVVRVQTLDVLGQDYVRMARSKRLPTRTVYLRHVLPNVLSGTVTIGGVVFAQLLGGVVVVEQLFAWPGIGTTLVSAVIAHDYPVVQGIGLMLGVVIVLVNASVDLLLRALDPRSLITGMST
jgi:peptide/nickel transport system permease protein